MNKLLLTAITMGLLTAGDIANAADVAPMRIKDGGCGGRFQGIYIGGHAGGVNYTANRTDNDSFLGAGGFPTLGTFVTTSSNALAGAQGGYNVQCRNAVFGFEADGSWTQATGKFRAFPNFGPPESTVTSRLDTIATARARAGIVAADSLLLYVTGGLGAAQTRTTWSVVFPGGGPGDSDIATIKEWNWGWVAGFGAEWAWTDRVSLRAEALYLGLPDRSSTFTSLFANGPVTVTHSDSMWVARAGINFRLTRD
jgi:outer membrane immunogenic protein